MSEDGTHLDLPWAKRTEVGDPCYCGGHFEWLIPEILACDKCDCITFYHGDTQPHVFLARAIRAKIKELEKEVEDMWDRIEGVGPGQR